MVSFNELTINTYLFKFKRFFKESALKLIDTSRDPRAGSIFEKRLLSLLALLVGCPCLSKGQWAVEQTSFSAETAYR